MFVFIKKVKCLDSAVANPHDCSTGFTLDFPDRPVLICKSKYMTHFDVPSFKINGETIQEVDNVKYLGYFFSNTLRDDKAILRQCRQL